MKRHMNLKVVLAGIFVIALALRIIAVVGYSNEHKVLTPCDQRDYDKIAIDLVNGKGYIHPYSGLPSSWRAPAYPVFLAIIYKVFGHNYFIVRVIQAIMSALLCVLIFYIGAIAFSRKVGILSAAILAIYIPNILGWEYTGPNLLLTENLATLLLAVLTLLTVKHRSNIFSGILIGAIVLTKPFFSFLPIFFFLVILHKERYLFKSAMKKILPVVAGIMIIILPWTVRNYFVHKAFVPITTQGGEGLMAGNNPLVYGGPICNYQILFTEKGVAKINKMPEVEIDKFYRNYAIDYLRNNYRIIPKLMFKKFLCLWDVFDYDEKNERIYDIWYAIILMFGLLGLGKCLRRLDGNVLLLLALFATSSVSAMIVAGDPRWRYPIEPYLIIFASIGIFAIYNAFKNKIVGVALIGGVVGINLLIYVNSDLFLSWVRYFMRGCGL